MSSLRHLVVLQAECVRLCHELMTCLEDERVALIAVKAEEIAQTNARKEALGNHLKVARKAVRDTLLAKYGVETMKGALERMIEPEKTQWALEIEAWDLLWRKTRDKLMANQELIRHSLRNMNGIVESLKRLMGDGGTYSAAGKRVDAGTEGKVVEASY